MQKRVYTLLTKLDDTDFSIDVSNVCEKEESQESRFQRREPEKRKM